MGTSTPSFSSSGNNQPGSDLKQTRLWVTGGCFAMPARLRLAGSGDSRPAATQAAPTGETAGKSRLVTPSCPLLSPSIHWSIHPSCFPSITSLPFAVLLLFPDSASLGCLFSFSNPPSHYFDLVSFLFSSTFSLLSSVLFSVLLKGLKECQVGSN